MERLVYISTARQPITKPQLGQILQVSRANNLRSGVTGLLVTGGNRFLQALEGSDAAVDATFQRICHDNRHFAAVTSRDSVDTRVFGDWAMGCQLSAALDKKGRIATAVSYLISRIGNERIRAEFEQFALRHAA